MKTIDLTNQQFNQWTVIERAGSDKKGQALWLAFCSCGTKKVVAGQNLRRGLSKNCGCKRRQTCSKRMSELTKIHGLRNHPHYGRWKSMLERCYNEKSKSYKDYGGRGISICDEWHDVKKFIEWADLQDYQKGFELDRVDTNGNYEPSNCRFISKKKNIENRRITVFLEYDGITKPLAEWAKEYSINRRTLQERLARGWDTKRALETKVK